MARLRLDTAFAAVIAATTVAYFVVSHATPARPATEGASGRIAPLTAQPALLAGNESSGDPASVEGQLAAIFNDIEGNRLDAAMVRVDRLLDAHPNFRLANLIKGDLLLARAQPLTRFGQGGSSVADDQVADLREEAITRLRAYRTRPPSDEIPRYLMEMADDRRFAIVVDSLRSRLYVFENDKGRPRLVTDYYVTQGKLGADKSREGDKKTPIGVYHVTANLPVSKLPDFYGSAAFPINYPNEWDRRQGRDGKGIWLHGTPPDTYSRPPRASDGCVVLTNQDIGSLAKNLQVGLTPVIISHSVEWLTLGDWQAERGELRAAFDLWRADWESRDTERYARHYARTFNVDGQDRTRWLAQKRRVNEGKSWIKVQADNVSMFRNPGRDEYVVIDFDQDYQSNNLSNRMRKRQYWVREDGEWKIIFEGAA